MRTHEDPSVSKYRKETTIDKMIVPLSREIEDLRAQFNVILTKLQDVRLSGRSVPGLAFIARSLFRKHCSI